MIEVPGGHVAPIRADRSPQGSALKDHAYYIRRPGPESAPPETGGEWETLIRRCLDNNHERQVEAFRRILETLRREPELLRQVVDSTTGSTELLKQWTEASLNRLRSLDGGGVRSL